MLNLNMNDVLSVIEACRNYLVAMGAALVLAIICTIAVKKVDRPLRKLIRSEVWIAAILVVVIVANMICVGPLNAVITLATGSSTISEESTEEALSLCEEIAGEGIVLLENDGSLPMEPGNINVFGWGSTNPCYGGTGSGSLSDAYEKVTLLQGLENAGFTMNSELSEFYTAYANERPKVGMYVQDWTLPEPPADTYSDELRENAKAFSDTAMVVIVRVGGEGADLPMDVSQVNYTDNSTEYKDFEAGENYLRLSQSEEDMISMVCEDYDNVILVYNGANAMEFGFVEEYEQIRNVIWCPGVGQSGFNALGKILTGEINPSGKTVDIALADLNSTPIANNFGNFEYDNMQEFITENQRGAEVVPHFVNYVEGIYVGYRYYETAAADGVIDYEEEVVYPFGYGLAYTTFEQKMGDLSASDGTITFEVKVTNTGDTGGRTLCRCITIRLIRTVVLRNRR